MPNTSAVIRRASPWVVGALALVAGCSKAPPEAEPAQRKPLTIAPVWVQGREMRYKLTRTVKEHARRSGTTVELFLYGELTVRVEDVRSDGSCLQRWMLTDFSPQILLDGKEVPEVARQRDPHFDAVSQSYAALYRRHEFRLRLDRDAALLHVADADRLRDETLKRYERILDDFRPEADGKTEKTRLRSLLEDWLTRNPSLLAFVACPEAQLLFATAGKDYVLEHEVARRGATVLDSHDDLPLADATTALHLKLKEFLPETQTAVFEAVGDAEAEPLRNKNRAGFWKVMESWFTPVKEPVPPEIPDCKLRATYTIDARTGWPKTIDAHRTQTTSERLKEESFFAERIAR